MPSLDESTQLTEQSYVSHQTSEAMATRTSTTGPASHANGPSEDNQDASAEMIDIDIHRQSPIATVVSSRTPSPGVIPATLPPSASAKTRRQLLGNRKASEYPQEADHFSSHRDSLILAHKKMLLGALKPSKSSS